MGSGIKLFRSVVGIDGRSMNVAANPMVMRAATPKNGPRQLMSPSSGPTEIASPSAASYRMTALSVPALDGSTVTASAVAMSSALPSPHPA